MRLFCFAHAGGGASAFRQWGEELPEPVEVCAVRLPGREDRHREPAVQTIVALADRLVEVIAEESRGMPFAFFGHSMGALVAYELTRRLQEQRRHTPVRVFFAGRNAPQTRPSRPPLTNADEAALLAELRRLGGTAGGLQDDRAFLDFFLPLFRVDYLACQDYSWTPGDRLRCPLTAFGGVRDPDTSRESLEAWRELTEGPFELHLLPGDHFFPVSYRHLLLNMIAGVLVSVL